jgi:hypothetical protein
MHSRQLFSLAIGVLELISDFVKHHQTLKRNNEITIPYKAGTASSFSYVDGVRY